jgi:hypothetical protein
LRVLKKQKKKILKIILVFSSPSFKSSIFLTSGRVAQVVKCLPCKHEALSPNPSTNEKKYVQNSIFLIERDMGMKLETNKNKTYQLAPNICKSERSLATSQHLS